MIIAGYTRSAADNVECVVLAEEESDDTPEFQRPLIADDQDRALGQDTYALARAGAAVHYGGVREFALGARSLVLQLDPEAAEVLGLPARLDLPLTAEARELVSEHLRRILGTAVS